MHIQKTILVSSDNESFNNKIASLFKEHGLNCIFVSKNGEEVCESIYKENPDIILIEVFMPKIDAIGVMQAIKKSSLPINPIFIIMSSVDSETIQKQLFSNGASYLFLHPIDTKLLVERIVQLVDYDNNKIISIEHNLINDVVSNVLDDIGVPRHIKGYYYLRDSIILALEQPDIINSVTKLMYPTVAKKNATTTARVERAIRHSVEVVWDRGNKECLTKYFGYSPDKNYGRPTNSEFISILSDDVRCLKAK